MTLIPEAPAPRYVMTRDGLRLATYDIGDGDAPAVVAVHGFASSADVNWFATGWVRELTRAGFRVIALDQRGHGASDKPHEPAAYSMQHLVEDVQVLLDTYLVDEAFLVGYSLGARVGWHAALGREHRITRAVLGGIPDGRPLTRFRVAEARAHLYDGAPLDDRLTRAYIQMAERSPHNDLGALIALVEGIQDGLQPDPSVPPTQPVLFATGAEDAILAASRGLAAATPQGVFYEIPGRNHFNAPTARAFRDRALEFLQADDAVPDPEPTSPRVDSSIVEAGGTAVESWTAALAALLLLDRDPATEPTPRDRQQRLIELWPRWSEALATAGRLRDSVPPPAVPRG